MNPSKIAFVGTGVMGSSMAGHLMDAGHELTVHNRTKERAQPLLERGARWAATPGEAAKGADVVITIVGYPSDVEEVYLGEQGVIASADAGALLIDMTTSSPELAERIAARASERGMLSLDAPVSGGDVGARSAALTIMVGGSEEGFSRAEPLLRVMGKSVILQGGPGAGQHAKMANQIAIAGSMLAMAEMLTYAEANGLDPAKALESVQAGSASSWSLQNLAPRVLGDDFAPGFYVKHFVKDLRIALEAAEEAGIALPGLELAKRLYERLADAGGGDYGTQALWLLYADAQRREARRVDAEADSRL